jgi:ribosomal protein S13
MSKNLLLYLLLFYSTILETECVLFHFNVRPGKNYCVGEYLAEDTVAIFAMSTDVKNIIINLNDPKGKNLYNKKYQQDVRVSLTATESGNYEMCLKNNDRKEIKVSFEFLSGIMAQDASEVAKESSIQPAEAAIVRLKDMSKDLINDLNSVVKEEDINLKANDAISSKITMVSILTLIVMVSVGVIETIYIKKYLQNRKLI